MTINISMPNLDVANRELEKYYDSAGFWTRRGFPVSNPFGLLTKKLTEISKSLQNLFVFPVFSSGL